MGSGAAQRLDGIQILRGMAACLVVLYHLTLHSEQFFKAALFRGALTFGNIGVDLFFVISGFIIYRVHGEDFGTWQAVPAFAAKRFARIFPPYWAVLLATVLGHLLLRNEVEYPASWDAVLPAVFLIYGAAPIIVAVAWTLSYELIFYIVFALLLPLRRRVALVLLVGWGLVALSFGWSAPSMALHPWVAEFVLGCLVAATGCRFNGGAWLLTTALAIFMLAGMAAGMETGRMPDMTRLGMVLFCAVLVLVAANVLRVDSSLIGRGLLLIGNASYSIYLTHYIAIQIVYTALVHFRLLEYLDAQLFNIGLFVALTAGGCIFHVVLEKPLVAFFRSHLGGLYDRKMQPRAS